MSGPAEQTTQVKAQAQHARTMETDYRKKHHEEAAKEKQAAASEPDQAKQKSPLVAAQKDTAQELIQSHKSK